MGSHKTKEQLEKELNELKNIYKDKCQECDKLSTLLEVRKKDLADARAELSTKEACNKKLADQFYDYRNELTKVRKDLADAIEKRDSFKVELEGVRGALKREADLRVDTEKKRDEYKQEAIRWKNEAGQYRVWWESVCRDNELLKNFKADVEKIMQKYCILTMDSLDNQLRHWKYTDNKLSHDLCMPLESLIHMLDEYDVNDFCKLRDRLTYAPTAAYSNALAQVMKLEKENATLKALSDDLEKQRRELEQKLAQERNVSMVQEARATDLEGQLRRKTEFCSDWMNRAFRDEEELKKVKEHDRIAQENFEKAARKNDELQNEVNKLRQRWTDEFNPEDELLGRKVLEWQEINVVLAKHNIENSMVLDAELDMLKEYRKVLDKHGIMGPPYLDKRISQSCPEEYMKVFSKYGIDSAEKLDGTLEKWFKVRQCSITLRNDIPYLGSIADFIKELA